MRQLFWMGVAGLLCGNCMSFVLMRVLYWFDGGLAGRIKRRVMGDSDGGIVTVLVAGNLNQATRALRFLDPELQGVVLYVDFRMIGWDARSAAERIAKRVRNSHAKRAVVYTISLGDHVARYLEELKLCENLDLEIIAINPCSDITFVRKPLDMMLRVGAPVFEVFCHALGWLSVIPIIPVAGGYSLILLADQFWSIAYDRHVADRTVDDVVGVVCSQPEENGAGSIMGKIFGWSHDDDTDGLLDNTVVRKYFQKVRGFGKLLKIVTIPAYHGSTDDENAYKYLGGIRKILRSHRNSS